MGASEVIDIIGIDELAKRLGVEECDVKKAIKLQQFVPGQHFFYVGTKPRFQWGPNLIRALHQTCVRQSEVDIRSPKSKTDSYPSNVGKTQPGLNLAYFNKDKF
ncbi:MAG TPA: hypothetical protein VJ550_03295 [Geomonas sp.]|nr:hypothetical protein [Geomonas sp.]